MIATIKRERVLASNQKRLILSRSGRNSIRARLKPRFLNDLRTNGSFNDDERKRKNVTNEKQDIVIITGCLGFIGSHLSERYNLLAKKTIVIGIDDVNERIGPYPVSFKRSNLKRLEKIFATAEDDDDDDEEEECEEQRFRFLIANCFDEEQMRTRAYDCVRKEIEELGDDLGRVGVIHCAAMSGVADTVSNPMSAFKANVVSTAVALELAKEFGASFCLLSSGAAYGDGAAAEHREKRASAESDGFTYEPTSPYACSKIAAEAVAMSYKGLLKEGKISIARIFTCYGERGRPDMAITRFMSTLLNSSDDGNDDDCKTIAKEKILTMFGDGDDTWRDYCHVDDVCEGISRALFRENGNEIETFNISSGKATTLSEIFEAVKIAVEQQSRSTKSGADNIRIEKLPKRPGDVGGTFANVEKAKTLLDWEAKIDLGAGLFRVAEFYSNSKESKRYRV
jgi:UDP-glucuronate 4-epimerase